MSVYTSDMTHNLAIPSTWQACASVRKGYAMAVRTMDHAKRGNEGSGMP